MEKTVTDQLVYTELLPNGLIMCVDNTVYVGTKKDKGE